MATDAICACPLIDHGQQPMKMHTEVTLLYKKNIKSPPSLLIQCIHVLKELSMKHPNWWKWFHKPSAPPSPPLSQQVQTLNFNINIQARFYYIRVLSSDTGEAINKLSIYTVSWTWRVMPIENLFLRMIFKQRPPVLNIVSFPLHPVAINPKGTAID